MIYVSSACVKNNRIADSVQQLAEFGFTNIELSGGTNYYEDYLKDLRELKLKHNLNYLVHNYFPPPKEDFVINLASCEKETADRSLEQVKQAVTCAKELGLDTYSVHAGFLINIPLSQVGKQIQKTSLFDRKQALQVFESNVKELIDFAGPDFKIYIENNVVSEGNFKRFNDVNPFFLTNAKEYDELSLKFKFKLLLDVAHLKVSCHTSKRNLETDLKALIKETDYVHISDNNGKVDSNKGITKDSHLYQLLQQLPLQGKNFTLEVYDGLESLKTSYELIQQLI